MPVPIARNTKSGMPRAVPSQLSPMAASRTSFSIAAGMCKADSRSLRKGTFLHPLRYEVATTTPASASVMPGAPAATANSERRETEAFFNRQSTPSRICSMTMAGEEVRLVDADHLSSKVPFMSASATRKLLPPMSTPTTYPEPALMRTELPRRPMADFLLCGIATKPFFIKSKIAAVVLNEESPHSRPNRVDDLKSRSRKHCNISRASVCVRERWLCAFCVDGGTVFVFAIFIESMCVDLNYPSL